MIQREPWGLGSPPLSSCLSQTTMSVPRISTCVAPRASARTRLGASPVNASGDSPWTRAGPAVKVRRPGAVPRGASSRQAKVVLLGDVRTGPEDPWLKVGPQLVCRGPYPTDSRWPYVCQNICILCFSWVYPDLLFPVLFLGLSRPSAQLLIQ